MMDMKRKMDETIGVLKERFLKEHEEHEEETGYETLKHRQNLRYVPFERSFRNDEPTSPNFGAVAIYITGWHDKHYVGSIRTKLKRDICKAWFVHYCTAIEGNSNSQYDEKAKEIEISDAIEAALWKERRQTNATNVAWQDLCTWARMKIPGYEECIATNTNEGLQPPHEFLYVIVYPEDPRRDAGLSSVSECPLSISSEEVAHHYVLKLEGIGIKHCWKFDKTHRRCLNRRSEGEGTTQWEHENRILNKIRAAEKKRRADDKARNARYLRRNGGSEHNPIVIDE